MMYLQITHANFIIYSYYYLIDPKVAGVVSDQLGKNSVVIFDEAHNIGICLAVLLIGYSYYSMIWFFTLDFTIANYGK